MSQNNSGPFGAIRDTSYAAFLSSSAENTTIAPTTTNVKKCGSNWQIQIIAAASYMIRHAAIQNAIAEPEPSFFLIRQPHISKIAPNVIIDAPAKTQKMRWIQWVDAALVRSLRA